MSKLQSNTEAYVWSSSLKSIRLDLEYLFDNNMIKTIHLMVKHNWLTLIESSIIKYHLLSTDRYTFCI